MTDAHCHLPGGETRHFLCDPCESAPGVQDVRFIGLHPWLCDRELDLVDLRARLAADPALGVGEIGLDRLKERTISPRMREVFAAQLVLAAEFRRPVVLHGAKCWGEVIRALPQPSSLIPSFLFHGFSRSDGLLPEIVALNGYVSVGPSLLNDHAVNYCALVRKVPIDRLLVESDRTSENAAAVPSVRDVATRLSTLREVPLDRLVTQLEANADAFLAR